MSNRIYYGEYTLRYWIDLIFKGNIVLPEYQRTFVWNKNEVVNLIQSLKMILSFRLLQLVFMIIKI